VPHVVAPPRCGTVSILTSCSTNRTLDGCQPTQVVDACRFILERWPEPADLVVAKVSSDTEEVTGLVIPTWPELDAQ
jgi:hypothetical protein